MKKTEKKGIGVYIHVPFCIRKCNYCDFCSFPSRKGEDMEAYTEELCRRIRAFEREYGRRVAETVYFGGGTPSLLPISCFEKIFEALGDAFDLAEGGEITVECNPATISEDSLLRMRGLGVNRLSIGLQSASDTELKALGRLHGFSDFCESFSLARGAGFDNISVDLMYGIPEQSRESFCDTLERVAGLSPEHISAYGLKIEEGTRFAEMRRELRLPDEDAEFEMYVDCRRILEANGYHRYEISNYAKEGRESRHNLRYWRREDYIGFGVAAHSSVDGERFGNSRDMDAFLRGEDIVAERERINDAEAVREYVMLGLRLAEGISEREYLSLTGREIYADMPALEKFVRAGFLVRENGRIAFSDSGFFVSNAILSEILPQNR